MHSQKQIVNQPLITVGLLTFNNKTTLTIALESLLKQTYQNKEIVVYDDCSTDNTWDVLSDYSQKYSFIKIYRNITNIGVFKNLSQLVANISGEYFFWACPDDEYHPDFISSCIHVLQQSEKHVSAISSIEIVSETSRGHQKKIAQYQNISFVDFIKNRKRITNSVLYRHNHEQYAMYIHSVIKTKVILTERIFSRSPYMFSIEELFPFYLILSGGILALNNVFYTKHQSIVPLKERNPAAYNIAYGLKNKILCLFHWYVFAFKSSLPAKAKMELHMALASLLYRHTILETSHRCIKLLLTLKNTLINRRLR